MDHKGDFFQRKEKQLSHEGGKRSGKRLKREEEAAEHPARLLRGSGVAGSEGSATRGGTWAESGRGGVPRGRGAAGGGWFWPLLLLLGWRANIDTQTVRQHLFILSFSFLAAEE